MNKTQIFCHRIDAHSLCRPVNRNPRHAAKCNNIKAAAQPGKSYIDPVEKEVSAFAPATVANLGPGYDWMGCAVDVR